MLLKERNRDDKWPHDKNPHDKKRHDKTPNEVTCGDGFDWIAWSGGFLRLGTRAPNCNGNTISNKKLQVSFGDSKSCKNFQKHKVTDTILGVRPVFYTHFVQQYLEIWIDVTNCFLYLDLTT